MRRVATLAFLAVTAFAQTGPLRISADDAAKHFLKGPEPDYPTLAQQARIQGNVILEVRINESGLVTDIQLVSGHPMLAPAAIEAVRYWKYQPIQADGKPVSVVTDVLVTFGDKKYYAPAARAELAFRYEYWTAVTDAEASIAKTDYAAAEEKLNRAKLLLGTDNLHPGEKWEWLTTSGRLRLLQQKYEEAEQYFKEALTLESSGAKDSPANALSLSNLAIVFADEKKFDLARQNSSQALSIYQKNLKNAKGTAAQAMLRQAVVAESLRLLKIAEYQNDEAEKKTQCWTLGELQTFLNSSQKVSVAAACPSLKLGP